MIKEFEGEFRWLSNFALVPIELDGITYPSVEHAYMSAKSDDKVWKELCSNPNNSPGFVKKQSKMIKLVNDWNTKKLEIMKICINQKFNQEPFKSQLLATGTEFIQEGNMWNDKFWGICLKTNKGENHLGKLIMAKRELL